MTSHQCPRSFSNSSPAYNDLTHLFESHDLVPTCYRQIDWNLPSHVRNLQRRGDRHLTCDWERNEQNTRRCGRQDDTLVFLCKRHREFAFLCLGVSRWVFVAPSLLTSDNKCHRKRLCLKYLLAWGNLLRYQLRTLYTRTFIILSAAEGWTNHEVTFCPYNNSQLLASSWKYVCRKSMPQVQSQQGCPF